MTGSAGGLAGGLWSELGAELLPGAEAVLDAVGFDRRLAAARRVLTGEGRLDSQSLEGKLVGVIAQRCLTAGRPLDVVAGAIGLDDAAARLGRALGAGGVDGRRDRGRRRGDRLRRRLRLNRHEEAAGSIRTPGLSTPAGSSCSLAARSAVGEGVGALAVIPGPVVAADRVVVGDRAPGGDHGVGGGGLDLVPLLDLAAAARRGEDGEVGGRTVRVDVGEAAAQPGRARAPGRNAAGLGDGAAARPRSRSRGTASKRSQVIAVSKVSERTPSETKVSRR